MQRYFADISNNQVFLSSNDQHHLLHVMRSKVNDEIEVVFNNSLFLCKVANTNPLRINVLKEVINNSNLPTKVTLFCPLLKGEKMDFVVQKATELGVFQIVFIKTKRSVVKVDNDDFVKKIKRYEMIAKEASEQSKRISIPILSNLVDINNIPSSLLSDINLVAYENLSAKSNPVFDIEKNKTVSFLIGPEGGFEENEIELLIRQGFKSISLGKRILRAETAAIYGLSVISYLLEK